MSIPISTLVTLFPQLIVGFVICFSPQTDDKGVFASSLSEEYLIASQTFGLTGSDLHALAEQAIQFAFDNHCKKDVTSLICQ